MMKITNRKNIALGAGLLGIATVFGVTTPTLAAPRNNDVRQERREVKEARRDVKQERHELRRADTPAERREERRDVKEAQRDLKQERHELKQEKREDRRDNTPNWNNHPNYNRPNYNYPSGNYNGYYGGNYGSYYGSGGYSELGSMPGTVISNPNGNRFVVRADDNRVFTVVGNFNDRNIRVGSRVEVYGRLTNGNVFVADSVRVF
jgi:hypothetical protein